MKQYDSILVEQAFQTHMSFRGGSGGRRGEVLTMEEKKVLPR